MPIYFAYGSNLNLAQMRRRCPDARAISRAVLHGYRLVFPRRDSLWRGGVAGIEADAAAYVEGAVYELSDADMASLDGYEGIAQGDYIRGEVDVVTADGSAMRVYTYFAQAEPGGPFVPSRKYLDAIIGGARDHQLSRQWIERLEAMPTM